MLAALFISAFPQEPGATPLLRVGETIEGEITDSDLIIHSPGLDASDMDEPVVGRTFRIEIESPGLHTIELVSHLFDAYLVLRDEAGVVLAEDDDGFRGTHSRMVRELEPRPLLVEACALQGQRGAFELKLTAGQPRVLSDDEARAAELSDLERALETRRRVLGPDHPGTADGLCSLAAFLGTRGDSGTARRLYEEALAIRERTGETENPQTAQILIDLSGLLQDQGDFARARLLLERTLAMCERALGPDHHVTAGILKRLADLLRAQGDYTAARPHYERARAIEERVCGAEHPHTARSLSDLASLLEDQGDLATARPLFERALALREKVFGPEDPSTAASLNNLARLLVAEGDFATARRYYERAIAICERALGPEHADTSTCLNGLGVLLFRQGDFSSARPLLERALSICERVHGPDHPDTAVSLDNLGALLDGQGDHAGARSLFERALKIREDSLGQEHPDVAYCLNNLALAIRSQGDYRAARGLLERALAIREKTLGPEHPSTATSLNNLAFLLTILGDGPAARPLFERALAIWEKTLGPGHPDTARSLNNIAGLLWSRGDLDAARPYYERAVAIQEKALGPDHPDTATGLNNLARLLSDSGDLGAAWDSVCRAWTLGRGHQRRLLTSLSETESYVYLARVLGRLEDLLSLALALPADPRMAYEAVVSWKGQVGRELFASRERLLTGLTEEQREVLERLRSCQADLSRLAYEKRIPDPADHESKLQHLRERRNELELELRRLDEAAAERDASFLDLRARLPPDSALLDFLEHRLYRPARREDEKVVEHGAWQEARLSVWITRRDLDQPVHLDLGPASQVELAIRACLEDRILSRVTASRGISVAREAQSRGASQLRGLLWDPISAHLEGARTIFVSPDGLLGRLPLEILQLDDESYLIEHLSFVYLQDPAALARMQTGEAQLDSLLCMGGVNYEERADTGDRIASSTALSGDLVGPAATDLRGTLDQAWPALAFTARESEVVHGLHSVSFRGCKRLLLLGAQASEERLKRELPGYSVVHLATHGFFNPEGVPSRWESAQKEAQSEGHHPSEEIGVFVGLLPGLLTGLVCAGANAEPEPGRDDGFMTAEEVGWLDLSKVELVVLSACETGIGRAQSGEGLLGLRRAFEMAGAKTVISSLWSVKDESTARLMQSFYTNLWRKKMGRGEALRAAQLEMLARNRAEHGDALPSTWGAFVLSGEWR